MFVRVGLCVAVLCVVWGCDSSAPAPAKSRVQLGGGESAPPPPPAAAGSVAARPQAAAAAEPSAAEPAAAPATATASPPPAPAEPAINAEQQALLDQADPKNWRKDYYAFLKNVQVVDGKISWGEMKEFERWFHLLHQTTDAMFDGVKERNSGAKGNQAANKYLRLEAEFRDATKKLGTVTWSARVVSNPRSSGTSVKLALPDLPAPATTTFWIPKEEVEQWNAVQDGDTVRFRATFNVAGGADSPMLMVYMHLLP